MCARVCECIWVFGKDSWRKLALHLTPSHSICSFLYRLRFSLRRLSLTEWRIHTIEPTSWVGRSGRVIWYFNRRQFVKIWERESDSLHSGMQTEEVCPNLKEVSHKQKKVCVCWGFIDEVVHQMRVWRYWLQNSFWKKIWFQNTFKKIQKLREA